MKTRIIIIATILVSILPTNLAQAEETNWSAIRKLLYTDATPANTQPAPTTNTPTPAAETPSSNPAATFPTTLAPTPAPAVETNLPVAVATDMAMESLDDHKALGPGDRVMYQVIEDRDPPRSLTVTETGDLPTPYYGLVPASGMTCRKLAADIKTRLEKNLYHRATVIVAIEVANKAWVTGKVYVTGQVKQPGGFEITAADNLTVSKAILNAGGFSDFSDKKHVRLIRKTAAGDKTFEVNVLNVWNGHLTNDIPVQPGDTVVVPASLINY